MAVSMRQIAEAAGCSVCTVSKALRSDPKISEATRVRVRRVADQLGYRPVPALSRVIGRRASDRNRGEEVVAFVHSRGESQPESHLNRWLIQGARDRAREMGYRLEVFDLARFERPQQLDRILYARGVSGVLLGSFREPLPEPSFLRWDRYSAVWVGRRDLEVNFPLVRLSYFASTRKLLQAMASSGCRRIGVVHSQPQDPEQESAAQLGAVMLEAEARPSGARIFRPLLLHDSGMEQSRRQVEAYIARIRPDGLLVRSLGTASLIYSMGYQIPDEFRLASIYTMPNQPAQLNEVGGILHTGIPLGREAVNLVDASLRQGLYGTFDAAKEIIVPAELWLDAPSLGGVNGARIGSSAGGSKDSSVGGAGTR